VIGLMMIPFGRPSFNTGDLEMKILVAGGTGAIGRPLIAKLLAEGHAVVALTRSQERPVRCRNKAWNLPLPMCLTPVR
jgi:hypothetical protein